MRKIILTFILVLASGFVLYCSYVCVKNINTIGSESEVKGKEMSSDEYIYKEDLLHLGYNLNDIEVIQNKISNVDVKEYFLKEKYDNISSYINALNFIPKNISRYVAYHNRNQNMTYDNTVLNVNMNLDYDFYTNVNTLHNYLDITTLVNKYNKLPDNYEIDDLVVLDNEYSNKGEKVRKVIYNDLKKMFDEIMSGNPAVFVDKALYNKNTGDLSLQLFNRDLRSTYIANDILETMRKIKVMFFNDIGVPNANTEKKERLITDEVNANNIETQTKFSLWLDEIKRGFEKANKLFNLDLSVNPSFERSENCVNKSPDTI